MSTMPEAQHLTDAEIAQFPAAASATVAEVRFCWLITRSADGGTNARVVNASPGALCSDPWTRRFLVRCNGCAVSPRLCRCQHDRDPI